MNILKLVSIVIFVVGFGFLMRYVSMSLAVEKDNSVLIVGTSADYPPYEFINVKTGEVVGFDVDVVTEVARRLGRKLILKDMPFSALVFGLLTGEIDMIAAGMSPTPRRARVVAFTDIYLHGLPLVILSKKSRLQPQNVQDLVGKTVAVNLGFIADMYMSAQQGVTLVKLKSPVDCFMDLDSGSVDAFVCAESTVKIFLQNNMYADQFYVHAIAGTGETCAFALDKQNKDLLQDINVAIASMIADGTMDNYKQKWEF